MKAKVTYRLYDEDVPREFEIHAMSFDEVLELLLSYQTLKDFEIVIAYNDRYWKITGERGEVIV